jgi:hypothetical protein
MKKLLLILLCVPLLFSCGEKENDTENTEQNEENEELGKDNDLQKENLKGNIKCIVESHYKATKSFGEIEKGEKIISHQINDTIKYNHKGYITETSKDLGIKLWKYYYKYNEEGLLKRITTYYNSKLLSKEEYKYNNKNQLIETVYYSKPNPLLSHQDTSLSMQEREEYKYNQIGKLIEKSFYSIDYKPIFEHINNPEAIELKSKYVYKYDKIGNKIESISYDIYEKISGKYQFIYDTDRNMIYKKTYNKSGEIGDVWQYKYDKNGNKTEESNSQIIEGSDFKIFNEDGTPTDDFLEARFNLNIKFIYEYTYDKNMNWIKRIIFRGENPTEIQEREIEYYK